ncbi:MAG: hypothetical protein ACREP1_12820, partial [Rhodanobacteraceae bacterium]
VTGGNEKNGAQESGGAKSAGQKAVTVVAGNPFEMPKARAVIQIAIMWMAARFVKDGSMFSARTRL